MTRKTNVQALTVQSGEIKEFRKTNEAIGLRVQEGRFSLLSRKVWNVLVYHAQQLRAPGLNAPITNDASGKYYWIPLADVAKDAAYDSNDTIKLKEHLVELQNIRIVNEGDLQWTSQRLISAVTLVNPLGLKRKGGQLWLGFAFPPEVEALVMSPENYTKLSFIYQAQFRSGASLALYEICRRYLTNPSKVTNRREWEWWWQSLTGNPIDEVIPEYKYVKRDVLKPAIAEINVVTDINIEMIEHKKGRRVVELQFKVVPAIQPSLKFPAPPVIDMAFLDRIMRFGISQDEAKNLYATTDEAKLHATVLLVEDRMAKKNMPALDSPAGFFKTALRDSYATPGMMAKKAPVKKLGKPSETTEELKQRYLVQRSKEAFATFTELPDSDQIALLDDFKATSKASTKIKTAGLGSAVFRNEFSYWYAQSIWVEPSADELLKFAIEYPKKQVIG